MTPTQRAAMQAALDGYKIMSRYMDGRVDDGPAVDLMVHEQIESLSAALAEPERAYAAQEVAAERERCAKLCDKQALDADGDVGYRDACHDCGAVIRGA